MDFCTYAPKIDMGQSSRGDVESRNVDMKNELESFRVHVDSKFVDILQAIVDLNKKVHAKRGLQDVTPNDGIGGSDSSKEVVAGDVGDGVGGGVGVGEENDSQFDFVSVSESIIAAITQKYYNNKKGENEKVPDVNVNTRNLVDDEFLKNLSKSDIASITQAAKVGIASTKVAGDE
ncbi:hypothetical protein K7X08_014645 [Anisodus acutangulus]|uniref:Uncharacterized protein n=1 Tax=Anisodus acutangulus TaxID=402998 RepID=A0A9Q1R336_9SOLA|nr:hypothetical protein K7X08_014645 [Anisodus acutangulus]